MTSRDRIRQRAVRLLSRRTHTRRELEQKLQRHFDQDQIDPVIRELQQRGYLDDEKAALERASYCRQVRHWGDRKIAADLNTRGIDDKIIEDVLRQVNLGKSELQSLNEMVGAWIGRKGRPQTAGQLKKLHDHGVRRGFPAGLIRQVLEPYFSSISWPSR